MIVFLDEVEKWVCVYQECDAKCCSEGVELTLEDYERISEKHSDFAVFEDSLRLKGKNGKCIFLREDLKCEVESYKPIACKLLPFVIEEVKYGDEAFIKLKLVVDCPGMGRGSKVNIEEIEKLATKFLHEKQGMVRRLSEDKEAFLKELNLQSRQ